jgi:HAD superfamily hydrolase (TIGR01490 family)
MTAPKARLVLFDLDHTLLPIDSDYCWSVFTTDIGWTDSQVFRQRNDDFYAHYQAGTLDIHDYIRFATEAVRLQGPARAAEAHARFMREVVQPNLRPEALALVHKHQAAGDQVVIVTATNEFVTRPIATAFGVDGLIAVELERGADGWITGGIRGTPSFREGKVSRVEQWLAAHGLDWSRADITFYSDSANDLPLLERVDRPIATNPDPRLRAVAQERGWRILDLFSDET